MSYTYNNPVFRLSEYITALPEDVLNQQFQEKSLPYVMLKLYGFGEINISDWKEKHHNTIIPSGEFDLSYCLGEMPENLIQMQMIMIKKSDEIISFPAVDSDNITMNDIIVEVIK